MHAPSPQLLSGIGSGVGRCGNHSISIAVITEGRLLHEPPQETKKPQRETREREGESLCSRPLYPLCNEFNKKLVLVLLSLSAQFNTVWLPRSMWSDYQSLNV